MPEVVSICYNDSQPSCHPSSLITPSPPSSSVITMWSIIVHSVPLPTLRQSEQYFTQNCLVGWRWRCCWCCCWCGRASPPGWSRGPPPSLWTAATGTSSSPSSLTSAGRAGHRRPALAKLSATSRYSILLTCVREISQELL